MLDLLLFLSTNLLMFLAGYHVCAEQKPERAAECAEWILNKLKKR